MISTVKGRFNKFDAKMECDGDDFTNAKLTFVCDVASIDTGVADRDAHLRSPDFFDVEKFPQMRFDLTHVVRLSPKTYKMTGLCTIRDVTKELQLDAEFNGDDLDAYGQTKYGFDLTGVLKREDYGLTFQAYGGKGSAMVGNEIKLNISVQMIKTV
jgi:polyisoprenoid-binding protein YceI